MFRIFLAQQRSTPDVLLVTSLLQRWIAEPRPEPPLDEAAHDAARPPRAGHPAALPGDRRPGPERAVPLVRPAAGGRGAGRGAGRRRRRARGARAGPGRAGPRRADRGAGHDPGADRPASWPSGSSAASAATEPMLEVLVRRHYLEYELHDLRNAHRRRPAVHDRRLHARRPADPPGQHDRHGRRARRPGQRAGPRPDRRDRRPPGRARGGRRPLPVLAGPPGDRSRRRPTGCARSSPRCRSCQRVRRFAVAVAPGGRPVWYFTYRPSAGGVVEDDNVRGVHPMVGRRLNLWRLRDFRITRLTRPRTSCSTTASPATTRPTSGWSRWPRSASSPWSATRTARSPRCRTSERAIANCLEAIRRARTARGAAGARLEMNHVWVTIWPVVDAQVDELTALQRNIAPLTAGAGIEEVVVQGRVTGSNGTRSRSSAGSTTSPARVSSRPWSGRRPNGCKPLDDYAQKVLRARRRNTVYPYEVAGMVAGRGWHARRVRPRRHRHAGPGRAAARAEQGRPDRRA